jgi:hypothetical protein
MFENEGQAFEQPVESTEEPAAVEQSSEQTESPSSVVDLDSLDKFKYAGRELTPKELQSMVMMQSDYTRKTQALSEERKYYDNLSYDLAAVKANPALMDRFKQIYPEKFHSYLGYVTPSQAAQAAQAQENKYASIDPEVMQRFQRLEADMNAREMKAINAELDNKFKTLSEKYPFSDEEAAIARAQALLDRGEKLDDKKWDAIWKSVHDRNETLFKKQYSQQVSKQQSANAKGRDVAPGGGIPGTAPKQPRTLKEASALALEAMADL